MLVLYITFVEAIFESLEIIYLSNQFPLIIIGVFYLHSCRTSGIASVYYG